MMRYGIEVLRVGLFTAKIKLSNTVSRKLFESQGFILVRQTFPGTFFSFFFLRVPGLGCIEKPTVDAWHTK